jgi:hypothetical protein
MMQEREGRQLGYRLDNQGEAPGQVIARPTVEPHALTDLFLLDDSAGFLRNVEPSLGVTWIAFGRSDTVANTFRVCFDVGAGVIGSNAIAGVATILTCSQISVAGSGFFKVDVAGSFTSVSNPFSVTFYPVDSEGSGNSTMNQQFFVWGVGT